MDLEKANLKGVQLLQDHISHHCKHQGGYFGNPVLKPVASLAYLLTVLASSLIRDQDHHPLLYLSVFEAITFFFLDLSGKSSL